MSTVTDRTTVTVRAPDDAYALVLSGTPTGDDDEHLGYTRWAPNEDEAQTTYGGTVLLAEDELERDGVTLTGSRIVRGVPIDRRSEVDLATDVQNLNRRIFKLERKLDNAGGLLTVIGELLSDRLPKLPDLSELEEHGKDRGVDHLDETVDT